MYLLNFFFSLLWLPAQRYSTCSSLFLNIYFLRILNSIIFLIFPQKFCCECIEILLIFSWFCVMSLFWVYLFQHFLEVFNHILYFAFFHCLLALSRNLAALDRAKSSHPCLPVRTMTNFTHWWCPSMPLSIWNIDVCLKNNEYLTFSLQILSLPALIGPVFFSHASQYFFTTLVYFYFPTSEGK